MENDTLCDGLRWAGNYCDVDMFEDNTFVSFVIVYQIVAFLFAFFFLVWGVVGVCRQTVFGEEKKNPSSLGFWTVYVLLFGWGLRLFHLFDPVQYLAIVGYNVYFSVYYFGFIMFGSAQLLLIAIWIDLMSAAKNLRKSEGGEDLFWRSKTIFIVTAISFVVLMVFDIVIIGFVLQQWTICYAVPSLLILISAFTYILIMLLCYPVYIQVIDSTSSKRVHDVYFYTKVSVGSMVMVVIVSVVYFISKLSMDPNSVDFRWMTLLTFYLTRPVEIIITICIFMIVIGKPINPQELTLRTTE